ncbi:OmpH family outer membrane protein [Rhodoferax antarcticus]|uniref:OmpH family outer membrane protein n=1 Tax=Rhodoferax antarcticus TaxID=81479 RepID=UPI0009F8CB5E|nr:OmpH family outer membrane protein [Rhodoferax antarcticus]MCW2312639.1 outer membrane protein [Rhodoferax antarcticus]
MNRSTFATSKNAFIRWGAQLTLGSFLLCGVATAQASDFSASRIGFVNLERVLKESAPAKASQGKLEKEFSTRQKDLVKQESSFKTAVTKFQTDAPVLAETKRVEQQKKLMEQERDLQRLARTFQEELNKRKSEELQTLIASTNTIVKQLAATEKLDMVLQNAAFVDPKNDLTDRVLKMLE